MKRDASQKLGSSHLEAIGFEVWPSGGGCTAYILELSGTMYALVTDESGRDVPMTFDSKTVLGLYEWVGTDCYERWAGTYPTLKAMLDDFQPIYPWIKHKQCSNDGCRNKPTRDSNLCSGCITKSN